MIKELVGKKRKARQEHKCSYCGGTINKGERYHYARLKYDDKTFYDWKSHEKCQFIADELWGYIDPDEGMTAEDFDEGCVDFCNTFICPDCEYHHAELGCGLDEAYCIEKIYDTLQTKEVVMTRDQYGMFCFVLREREG